MARRPARPAAVHRADALIAPRRRLAGLLLVALALAPGTFVRTSLPERRIETLAITPTAFGEPTDWPIGLTLEGVWEVQSPDLSFGGYSALVALGQGRLLAFSDKGDSLAFTAPGRGAPDPGFAFVEADPKTARQYQDIESAVLAPGSGRLWLGYEQFHAIRRFGPGEPNGVQVRPPEMRNWPDNSGAEGMVRLADGRFLVLGERNATGLLFAGDPVAGARASAFAVAHPAGFRPTDAALLPDGRVLVLMRDVTLAWPPFRSLIAIADPQDIGREEPWRVTPWAALGGALPRENYEGLAVEREGDATIIWLISDDNFGTFQRTLLAKLRWEPGAM